MRKGFGGLIQWFGSIVIGVLAVSSVPRAQAQSSWSNGYAFRRAITIDHTKVPNTDQANFPVLISGTYPFLASTSNGGGVSSSKGYDLVFASDAAGTNLLSFEQESYSASTGALTYWVKVPTVSHTADTVIYVFYGNGSVTTDQSNKTAVWDTNYVGVWHLPNGTTLTATDSTTNANSGTIIGPTANAGKIAGGASLSGSTQYIDVGNKSSLQITGNAVSVEAWLSTSVSNPGDWQRIVVKETPNNADPYMSYGLTRYAGTNRLNWGVATGGAGSGRSVGSVTALTMGSWTHVVGTYDGTNLKIYVNGVLDTTSPGTGNIVSTSQNVIFGGDLPGNVEYFNGMLDEMRISNSARSADWIATEYSNESNPGTFYSVSSATVNGLNGSTAPYIAELAPASGPITMPVSILGANFGGTQGSSSVSFNGIVASPTAWSDAAIVVPVPAGATTGNVTVTVGGNSSNAATFTVTLPPTAGYVFQRAITIDHTKVPNTDQQNFPLLVSGTYPFLATAGNGGNVTSTNGYDIVFTSDAGGVNLLPFEQDSYSPTTGAVTYWVQVPNLSHTTDTTIYVFYGNGLVTTDQSNRTAVWDANFKGVWHLGNGTLLSTNDSTTNASNGAVNGTIRAASGKINGAASASGGTNNGITMANSITADSVPFTYFYWVNSTNGGGTIQRGQDGFGNGWSANVWLGTKFTFSIVNSSPAQINLVSNATVTAGTWYNVAAVWTPGLGMKLYVNGALDNSNTNNSTLLRSSTKPLQFLNDNSNNSFNGLFDEVQISSVARSADWIAAEYNNQSSPSTFYSIATPTVIGSQGTTSPYIGAAWPASGPITTPMTIFGANFGTSQGSSTVTFNGAPGAPNLWSNSSILVSVPTTATSGNVIVTVSGVSSNPVNFTVTNAPGAWTTFPSSGIVGIQVAITGIHFGSTQGTSAVTLNGLNCPVISWSDTAITVVVPSGATSGPFTVSVGGQTAISPIFTVTQIPTGWLDQDVGTVGLAGSASFANGTFTVKGAGTSLWGTADGFNFMYEPMTGDGTIVARVTNVASGQTAGVELRETLSPGAKSAFVSYYNGGVYFNYRTTTGGSTSQASLTSSLPYWVKITRSGSSITGYASLDGVNWSQVGSTQTISMAQAVYVGLGVSSGSTSTLATASLDCVSVNSAANPAPSITAISATTGSVGSQVILTGQNFGTSQGSSLVLLNNSATTVNSWSASSITITVPTGATSGPLVVSVAPTMNDSNPVPFTVTTQPLPGTVLDRDIGQLTSPGGASYAGGLFDLYAGGGIGGTSDKFHFVYEPLSGDGTVVARVVYLNNVNPLNYGQAGVMIRETLDPASACAFLWYQPNQTYFFYRQSAGASMVQQTTGFVYSNYPYWVKLTRSGNNITGYISVDGVYWNQTGPTQTIAMAQNIYIGLAVANGEGKFDNVSFNTASLPAPAITNISATTASIGGQVVITGTGFGNTQGASIVYLNGAPTTVSSWSATSITTTIPSGATTGYLAVAVAASMNNSNPVWFTVTANPLPSGSLDRSIGPPATIYPPATASFSNGVTTVNTAGNGISNTADAFHFIYQPLVGDGSFVTRILSVQGNQAGAMIRETLDPSSTSLFVNFSPNTAYLISRTTTGAAATTQQTGFSGSYPYWVRVTRSGNAFAGYVSSDGVYWTQVGTTQTISMAQTVYIGIATARGGTNGSYATFTYDSSTAFPGPVQPIPIVSSASPNPVGPGYAVTITGSNFGSTQGSSVVYFNGAPATSISSWSSTQIVAIVPTAASSGPVTVVVGGVGSNRSVSLTVYKPVITSLTPPAASPGGTITIAGSGFGGSQSTGFTVSFNGVNASAASWTDTSITAVVPSNSTSGPVVVTEAGIPSNSMQFSLLQPISVTGATPLSGSVSSTVTITGTGFGPTQSNSSVWFYGSLVTNIVSWTDTQIVAAVPSGASSGAIGVTVAGQSGWGPSFTVTNSVQVTDSLGNSSTYNAAIIGARWVPTSSQGSGCSSCTIRGTISSTYDNNGNVLTRTDELGRTTTYTYDTSNNMASVSIPYNGSNLVTSYTYNNFGEVLTATDPMGNVTTNTYDTNGNLTKVTTPVPGAGVPASATQFGYNALGQMTSITDPLSNVTNISYTPAGLIYQITDTQNNVTTYGYDSHANRTSVTDALNHTTTFAYDSGDRLQTITYPGNTGTTVFGYDYRGRRTSVTDQNGKTTTYAYDDADRLTSVTDAATNVTTYGYDTENNLTSIQDANSHTTNFAYDAFGRVTQTTFPSSAVETYSYDAVGNLTGKTDRKNQSITYTYDQLNRLTQKQYPDNSTVNYTYDNDSRLTQVTDPTGTYSFTFDNMGRLIGTTTLYAFLTGRTFTTAYGYDAASNRTGFTDPEAGATTYVYDTLNRLQTLTPPVAISAGSFGFGYDALSRRTSLTRPNAVNTTYGYDNLSRLMGVIHAKSGTTIDGATYTVDNAGNRTAKTDQRTAVATSYGYDNIYQLLSATPSTGTPESYTYDLVGNRMASLGVASYTTNSSNELTATSNASYGYDLNGNETSKTDSTGTTNYTWDYENRLTSVTLPGSGGTVSFAYDPFGRRIKKASNTGTSIFVYDSDNLIEEVNASGGAVARYSQGLNIDEPLAMLRSSVSSFYNVDGLGSVTSLASAAGSLAQTYTFDSFGKQTASSGSLTNPFQYTGRESDSETGLYYYRARYYDPSTGRFLSEDEVGNDEGSNLYLYVGNSPVDSRDPTGFYKLKGFPADKIGQMNNAINDAIARLQADCPSCAGPAGPKIVKALQNATYVYKPDDKDNCGVDLPHVPFFHHIDITEPAFDPKQCCALASTLAHEASHYAGVAGDNDQPGSAYDIEKKCFNCGTGHPPPKPPKKPKTR